MVLHTSRVTMSWRFHSDQCPAYTGKQQMPRVPLLGKGLSGCFTPWWFCTGFLPSLFCIFPPSVTVFGQDYDPKGRQSLFQFPVEKEIYLPWVTGIPHGNREHIHEGLIQWTPPPINSPHLVVVHSSPLVHLLSARAFRGGNISNFSFVLFPHDPWYHWLDLHFLQKETKAHLMLRALGASLAR